MRIAYIAPYQGPTLIKSRPTLGNRTLAGSQKIELIAELLRSRKHEVEIISHGEVDRFEWKFYPYLRERELFHRDIPVNYPSALPVRFVNGFWSSMSTLRHFVSRHRANPFDVVLAYNTKRPEMACASHAIHRLRIPVVLEYEDDGAVSISGETVNGFRSRLHSSARAKVLNGVSACIAPSPHLLSQVTPDTPKLLLRGVVGNDLVKPPDAPVLKKNWVLFSGTHAKPKGLEQLITAWQKAKLPDWELHITGYGEMTPLLKQMAAGNSTIIFHDFVNRSELVRLLRTARICINPHDLSRIPGNVFAFKIIEYLAAGAHVITTPMGILEKEIERGITYMPDNDPESIAATLKQVIAERAWESTAPEYVCQKYGPAAVSESLDALLRKVLSA